MKNYQFTVGYSDWCEEFLNDVCVDEDEKWHYKHDNPKEDQLKWELQAQQGLYNLYKCTLKDGTELDLHVK